MTSASPPARSRRWVAVRPASVAAACAVAALAAAGCGSGGGSGGSSSGGTGHLASHAMTGSQAMSAAANAAARVNSLTATVHVTSSGVYSTQVDGTLTEQLRPTLRALETFTSTANGLRVPGEVQTLLTGKTVYLKMATLSRLVGKPWAKFPLSTVKKGFGVSLAPLIHQVQGNDPLAETQMLRAARNVRKVGSATVSGVPTTEYSGTLDVLKAMGRLDPGLRKLVGPALAATGITVAHFTVWIDSQHQVRKLVETENGSKYQSRQVVTITSINQPVHISLPPASQVAAVPGL